MDYSWWSNETNGGFEHENDYTNSYYDPYAYNAPCEYICCNYCGYNHFVEQCPNVSKLDYMEGDFSRAQTHMYDDNFSLSLNQESSPFWDPTCSISPCVSHFELSPPFHNDEYKHIHREKPTIIDMLQQILDNQKDLNEHSVRKGERLCAQTLALENITIKVGEIVSHLESLRQKDVLSDISNDSNVDVVSSAQITIANDDVLPIAWDSFGGDCELELHDGESNIECLVEIPILEPNACCLEQENIEEIPIIYDLDPPGDILTFTDESQVDFMGFSNYLGALANNCEKVKLEPLISLSKLCIVLIEEVHMSCFHELSCLNYFCLKRNEDKIIMIFDTYD